MAYKKKPNGKNDTGRPPAFSSPKQLEGLIKNYFEQCDVRQRPPTIAGLAYTLEVDRQTIYNYEKKDEYFGIIKRARDRILMNVEEELILKGNSGTIFLAKNYGYTDKQELQSDINLKSDGFIEALKNETRKVWDDEDE